MSYRRKFHGAGINRLIVSVPVEDVEEIDALIRRRHPARCNRSEFVRLAIREKLARDKWAKLPHPIEIMPFSVRSRQR